MSVFSEWSGITSYLLSNMVIFFIALICFFTRDLGKATHLGFDCIATVSFVVQCMRDILSCNVCVLYCRAMYACYIVVQCMRAILSCSVCVLYCRAMYACYIVV